MNCKNEIIRNCKYKIRIDNKFIEKYLKLPEEFFDIPEIKVNDLLRTEITNKFSKYHIYKYNNEITVLLLGFNSNHNDISILLFPTIEIKKYCKPYSIIVYGYICNKDDIRKSRKPEDLDNNDTCFYKKLSSVKFLNNYKDIEDKIFCYRYYYNNSSISTNILNKNNIADKKYIELYNLFCTFKKINFPNDVLTDKDIDIGKYIISELDKMILKNNEYLINKLNLKDRIINYKNEEINKRSKEIDEKFFNIICNHKDFNFDINSYDFDDINSYYEEDLISWNNQLVCKLEKGNIIIGEKVC